MKDLVRVSEPPEHLRSAYDFQVDLPWAKRREAFAAKQVVSLAEAAAAFGPRELAEHLAGPDGQNRYEVKAERKAFETGNCFIEYCRVKRLGRLDSLEDLGDGSYRYAAARREKEGGRWNFVLGEDGNPLIDEHHIADGHERFKVERDERGNLQLIEWSGIRASTAEFWNIVLGRSVLTVPREDLLAAMREKWRREPSAHKAFSGDNGATRGVVMRVAEVALCASGDLLPGDWDDVEFAEPDELAA